MSSMDGRWSATTEEEESDDESESDAKGQEPDRSAEWMASSVSGLLGGSIGCEHARLRKHGIEAEGAERAQAARACGVHMTGAAAHCQLKPHTGQGTRAPLNSELG